MSLKEKVKSAVNWCKENKEVLVIVVPATVAVVTAGTKLGKKALDTYQIKNLQERKIYDRSGGCYYELRRALSNNDRLLIDQRRQSGERLGDILKDMRLLK